MTEKIAVADNQKFPDYLRGNLGCSEMRISMSISDIIEDVIEVVSSEFPKKLNNTGNWKYGL